MVLAPGIKHSAWVDDMEPMILTVLLASALVNRKWAVPIIALTWIVPVVAIGSSDEAIAKAIVLSGLNGYAGLWLRQLADRVLPRSLTARA